MIFVINILQANVEQTIDIFYFEKQLAPIKFKPKWSYI